MYVIFDSLSYKSLDNTVSFTIPDSALITPNGGTPARKIKIEGDSAVFQIAQHNSSIYNPTWVVTPTFKILGRDGKPTVRVAQNVSVHPVVLQGNAPINSINSFILHSVHDIGPIRSPLRNFNNIISNNHYVLACKQASAILSG